MKKRLCLSVLSGICMLCMTAMHAWAVPMAYLDVLDSHIAVGDTFQVQVWMDGDGIGEELLAFGFDVFPGGGTVFSYETYGVGPGFDDDSWGLNNVAGTAFPGIADNLVLLATLTFEALAPGVDTLDVVGLYDGLFSGAFYADFSGYDILASARIDVNPAAVAEPVTLLLFGVGLIGLAGLRRRSLSD